MLDYLEGGRKTAGEVKTAAKAADEEITAKSLRSAKEALKKSGRIKGGSIRGTYFLELVADSEASRAQEGERVKRSSGGQAVSDEKTDTYDRLTHLTLSPSDSANSDKGEALEPGSKVGKADCPHGDCHLRPARFAAFDLPGVGRDEEVPFCRTCERWQVGGAWIDGPDDGARVESPF